MMKFKCMWPDHQWGWKEWTIAPSQTSCSADAMHWPIYNSKLSWAHSNPLHKEKPVESVNWMGYRERAFLGAC